MNELHPFSPTSRLTSAALFLLLLSLASTAFAASTALADPSPRPVSSLTEGKPVMMGTQLSETDYVPIEARKLRDVPVLWVDYDYLREKGIRVPPQGLTPSFRQQLADAFGWSIVSPGDDERAFGPETRTFHVDFYGGNYTGRNIGGGRTGDVGQVQIKFFGKTPMVFEDGRRGHSDGMGEIPEGINEAFWGKLNHAELPRGANRAIVILERRTGRVDDKGNPKFNVLLARDPPSRPAHVFPTRKNERFARPTKDPYVLAEQVANSLPVPPGAARLPLAERLRAGLMNYAAAVGEQYGTAFGLRLEHGSGSHSNFELSGRFLDYGTQSAQPGYGRVWMLGWNDRAGELKRTKKFLARDLRRVLGWRLPPEIARQLPSLAEVDAEVDRAYASSIRHEFLLHTGVPPNAVQKFENSPLGVALGDKLHKLAVAEAREHAVWEPYPAKGLTRYDIHQILRELVEVPASDAASLYRRITPRMPANDRRELGQLYGEFMREARAMAAADGISEAGFSTLLRENARLRSLPRDVATIPSLNASTAEAAARYRATQDPRTVGNAVEKLLADASPLISSGDPYVTVLQRARNAAHDSQIQLVYDARKARREYRADFKLDLDKAWLVADSIPAADPRKLRAFSPDPQGVERAVPVVIKDGRVHLSWDAPEHETENSLRMIDADGRSRTLHIRADERGPLSVAAGRARVLRSQCAGRFGQFLNAPYAAR